MSQFMLNNFDRSGIAAISDMGSPGYQEIFAFLEKEQCHFLTKETEFRSKEYNWPRDPLHCWSRRWEYPYVFYHLKNEKKNLDSRPMQVVDFGSGVTFFPFSVASLGCQVHCLDIDPVCEKDLNRAIASVQHAPGEVSFSLLKHKIIPINDNQMDAVYSISVLEHIPDFEGPLIEIARVLKPGGLFILTIDLDMCGYKDIGVKKYHEMRRILDSYFRFEQAEVSTHPLDMLVQNSKESLLELIKFHLSQKIKKICRRKSFDTYPNLAVWGAVLLKK